MPGYRSYLARKAAEYRFGERKAAEWIRYMESDGDRAARLLALLDERFGRRADPGHRCLDVGCGHGGQLIALRAAGSDAWGLESRRERAVWARRRAPEAHVVCGNAAAMPWRDGLFDLIVASDVFEHVDYALQPCVAIEIARLLRPGGCGIAAVPNRFQLKDEHNGTWLGTWIPRAWRAGWARLFSSNGSYVPCFERTRRGWRNLFRSAGLQVEIVDAGDRSHLLLPAARYLVFLRKEPAR